MRQHLAKLDLLALGAAKLGRRLYEPGKKGIRVVRFLALAIKLDGLVRDGAVSNYAELGQLGHVTRARVTHILNLLSLAPAIQEEILFLPLTFRGRDPVTLRDLLPIAAERDWNMQKKLWRELITERGTTRVS